MFQNSLAGAHRLGDQPITIRRVLTESYSTTTGGVTRTTSDLSIMGQPRNVNTADRKGFGSELAAKITLSVAIHGRQLADGVTPSTGDEVVVNGVTYEVLAVRTISLAGMPTAYVIGLA